MLKYTYMYQPDDDCSIYNCWQRVLVVVTVWECTKKLMEGTKIKYMQIIVLYRVGNLFLMSAYYHPLMYQSQVLW